MNRLYRAVRLNSAHSGQKRGIVGRPIGAGVHSSMAVGAKSNNEGWVIRPAVTHAPNVVGLEVGAPVCPVEGGRLTATFTMPFGSRQDIISNCGGPTVNGARTSRAIHVHPEGRVCLPPQGDKVIPDVCRKVIDSLCHRLQPVKFEEDNLSVTAGTVRPDGISNTGAHHLPFEPEAAFHAGEKQQTPASLRVGGDRPVAPGHLHVTALAFARVHEDVVVDALIHVPMSVTLISGDEENGAAIGNGYDPIPLGPTIPGVDIHSPIVNLANVIAPAHPAPSTRGSHATGALADLAMRRAAA